MHIFLYVFALVAGCLNVVQAGANTTLTKTLGQPILSVLTVYTVGLAGTLILTPFFGLHWPQERLTAVPWWGWCGGLFGLVYVLAMMYVPDKVGAAIFTGLTVSAAVITSTALDHFGALGFETHPAGIGRLAGCGLMIAGLALIAAF